MGCVPIGELGHSTLIYKLIKKRCFVGRREEEQSLVWSVFSSLLGQETLDPKALHLKTPALGRMSLVFQQSEQPGSVCIRVPGCTSPFQGWPMKHQQNLPYPLTFPEIFSTKTYFFILKAY